MVTAIGHCQYQRMYATFTLIMHFMQTQSAALWTVDTALKESFADIDELSEGCRFTNCEHRTEPGCELLGAIKRGKLTRERVESWRKLHDEIDTLAFKQKEREAAQNKRPLQPDQLDTNRSKRRR